MSLFGSAFSVGSRVGAGEDDRSLVILAHGLDVLLFEHSSLSAEADENVRLGSLNHCQ